MASEESRVKNAFGSESVEVGSPNFLCAQTTQMRPVVFGDQPKDVGSAFWRCGGQARCQRSAKEDGSESGFHAPANTAVQGSVSSSGTTTGGTVVFLGCQWLPNPDWLLWCSGTSGPTRVGRCAGLFPTTAMALPNPLVRDSNFAPAPRAAEGSAHPRCSPPPCSRLARPGPSGRCALAIRGQSADRHQSSPAYAARSQTVYATAAPMYCPPTASRLATLSPPPQPYYWQTFPP